MGLLKDLFKLLMGLAAGFALGYAAVSWLLGQERRLSGAAGPGARVFADDGSNRHHGTVLDFELVSAAGRERVVLEK